MNEHWQYRRSITLLALTVGTLGVACNALLGTDSADPSAPTDEGAADASVSSPFALESIDGETGTLHAVWGRSDDDVWAVGEDGVFLRRENGEWRRTAKAAGYDLLSIFGYGRNEAYAVGVLGDGQGVVFRFDGEDWVREATTENGLTSVWGMDDAVFALGRGGTMFRRDRSGLPWVKAVSTLPKLTDVSTSADDPVVTSLVGNDDGRMLGAAGLQGCYLFEPGATKYAQMADAVDHRRSFQAVWSSRGPGSDFIAGSTYYGLVGVVDSSRFVGLYEDRTRSDAKELAWRGLWGKSASALLAVGDRGRIGVVHRDQPGNVLTDVPSPTDKRLYAAWGSTPSSVWIVGEGGTILHGAMP